MDDSLKRSITYITKVFHRAAQFARSLGDFATEDELATEVDLQQFDAPIGMDARFVVVPYSQQGNGDGLLQLNDNLQWQLFPTGAVQPNVGVVMGSVNVVQQFPQIRRLVSLAGTVQQIHLSTMEHFAGNFQPINVHS